MLGLPEQQKIEVEINPEFETGFQRLIELRDKRLTGGTSNAGQSARVRACTSEVVKMPKVAP